MLESPHIEWKQTWRDEFLKWICGFAYAEGGVLEIGRADDGAPVGVPDALALLEEPPNKIRDVLVALFPGGGALVSPGRAGSLRSMIPALRSSAPRSPQGADVHLMQEAGKDLIRDLIGAHP